MTPETLERLNLSAPVEAPLVDPRRPAPASDRPRHLHAVPGRPAPGRRPPVVLLAGVIITTLVLIGLVSINVLVGQSGVGADDLARTIGQKQQQADMLQVDVLRLSAPARIKQRAEQLGMISASDVTYLAPLPARASAPTSSAARTRGGR